MLRECCFPKKNDAADAVLHRPVSLIHDDEAEQDDRGDLLKVLNLGLIRCVQ